MNNNNSNNKNKKSNGKGKDYYKKGGRKDGGGRKNNGDKRSKDHRSERYRDNARNERRGNARQYAGDSWSEGSPSKPRDSNGQSTIMSADISWCNRTAFAVLVRVGSDHLVPAICRSGLHH